MKTDGITVLYPSDRKTMAAYTLYPFLFGPNRVFKFVHNPIELSTDQNKYIVLVGWYRRQTTPEAKDIEFLTLLKNKYRLVAYFDDNDGTEVQKVAFLPYFDLYFKKQLFSDLSNYQREFVGQRYFTEFYANKYGIDDGDKKNDYTIAIDKSQNRKLRLAWNITIGVYPLSDMRSKISQGFLNLKAPWAAKLVLKNRPKDLSPIGSIQACHARFGSGKYRPTVAHQRSLFLKLIEGNSNFMSGRVPKKQYDQEISRVQGVLSPFGWGEVCYRDAEAVMSGAVLFKPDMAHVNTWPNIYLPNKTYVPLSWDGSDLVSKVGSVLSNKAEVQSLRASAFELLRTSYAEIPKKVEEFIESIKGNA